MVSPYRCAPIRWLATFFVVEGAYIREDERFDAVSESLRSLSEGPARREPGGWWRQS